MTIHKTEFTLPRGRRIAVIGSGISGASAAWALSSSAEVTLYEADARAGGHTATVDIDYDGTPISVDTGFIVYNELNYPNLTALFRHLNVETVESDMGFALSLDNGRLEWCGSSLTQVFAQRRNVVSVPFLWMLREILRFNRQCREDKAAGLLTGISIGNYLKLRGFSDRFVDDYLIPMAAAIWSTPRIRMLDFPAQTFITFFENHRLIDFERPLWRTVKGGARTYLEKLLAPLAGRIRLGEPVVSIHREDGGVRIASARGAERYDAVVIATHSDQALAMLADPSPAETSVLSAVGYRDNRVLLHRDQSLMPRRRQAWAAWNYLRDSRDDGSSDVAVTYWMNKLQGIDARTPLFVSLNPPREPKPGTLFGEYSYAHPQFDAAALAAQQALPALQGVRNTWYAGAWTGYGFHEDGLKSGLAAAEQLGAVIPWREPAMPAGDSLVAAE
ncbi:NAD(P)/FAD-dependent oxidoreductase [Zhengella sp. ZM62]|uniref:NAD(P)/FAD-dependent oxidoreductase n=1 Tax=Zhengella sedimenti TaxID=3390035 RepID=UPI003975091F